MGVGIDRFLMDEDVPAEDISGMMAMSMNRTDIGEIIIQTSYDSQPTPLASRLAYNLIASSGLCGSTNLDRVVILLALLPLPYSPLYSFPDLSTLKMDGTKY